MRRYTVIKPDTYPNRVVAIMWSKSEAIQFAKTFSEVFRVRLTVIEETNHGAEIVFEIATPSTRGHNWVAEGF